MNVNGTALISSAMGASGEHFNTPAHRAELQTPTADTARMLRGLDPMQVSMDVGKAQGGGFGRVQSPAPAVPEEALVAHEAGRPQCWSPAPPSSDPAQEKIDAVCRAIAEAEAQVPYDGMLGVNPFNRRKTFLGDPGYAKDGLPYCRKTGTPQPDPLKYVWNAKKAGEWHK